MVKNVRAGTMVIPPSETSRDRGLRIIDTEEVLHRGNVFRIRGSHLIWRKQRQLKIPNRCWS
jgi:hypothetical protein